MVVMMMMSSIRSVRAHLLLSLVVMVVCCIQEGLGHEKIVAFDRIANEMVENFEKITTPTNSNTNWKLHRFSGNDIGSRALCLDGSYAGFWFSQGSGDGVNKFVVHHMGGGWCNSIEDCIGRSKNEGSIPLGGSGDYREHVTCEPSSPFTNPDIEDMSQFGTKTDDKGSLPCRYDGGLFSYNSIENPLAYNWNKVFVPYCDGASFSGSVEEPVHSNKTKGEVYFRGKDILNAVYDTLLSSEYDMNEATDVIITGSSAGGLATILHADYIANKIRRKNHNSPNIAGMPDAGFFMDVPSVDGEYKMATKGGFKDMYEFQGIAEASGGSLAECHTQYKNKGEAYKCLFPQYLLKYVETPMFFTQSFADAYQFPNVMGLSCGKNCNGKDVNYIDHFRGEMTHALENDAKKHDGWWLTGCNVHTLSYHSDWYSAADIHGVQMRYAIYGWYESMFVHKRPSTWQFSDSPWSNMGGRPPENCQ